MKMPPTYEAWLDPAQWEVLNPQETLEVAGGGKVKPHSGSIAWNDYRKKWVTIFVEHFGKPSLLGEVWYAEADSPPGPWGGDVKVLSHQEYTFYNPRIHPALTPGDSPVCFLKALTPSRFPGRKNQRRGMTTIRSSIGSISTSRRWRALGSGSLRRVERSENFCKSLYGDASSVERVSRPVSETAGASRHGPGDPCYFSRIAW